MCITVEETIVLRPARSPGHPGAEAPIRDLGSSNGTAVMGQSIAP